MGGLSCAVPHFALLPGNGIPSDPVKLPAFDAAMRQCFAQTDIVKGVVDADKAHEACAFLKIEHWNAAQRKTLYAILEGLYT